MSYEPDRYTLIRHYEDGSSKEVDEKDYFILRRGDLLATGTLWNYLANTTLILESDEAQNVPLLGTSARAHLEDLREAVHEKASAWQDGDRALPD